MGCFGSPCFGNCPENDNYNMNGMPEFSNSVSFDLAQHVQLCGILLKRPFGHNSTKWYRRFFVVRDGFLLYYPENEKKEMEKRKCLNIHPKGVVPLGECLISRSREPNQPFAFQIQSADISGKMLLAADSDYERDKWIDILEKSKRITWKHAMLADDMIKQLEDRGLKMAKQKQEYFDQLQMEVKELSDEREKKEELEKLNEELTKEKEKMEQYTLELTTEYEKTRGELEEMSETMRLLESDRESLSTTLSQQHDSLQELADEKAKVLMTLKDHESKTSQLSKENISLHKTQEELQTMLCNIEQKTQQLLHEKAMAEQRLTENEEKAKMLEEEKQHFDVHAQELKDTIKDLKAQKEMTEAELKEEVMARLDAERKLNEAESSLHKLDHAVTTQTPNIEHEVKEEMVVNVKKLKRFFEDLATEAKIDSDKPVVVKNAIHARKTLTRRAKNQRFERRKSNSLRIKSTGTIGSPTASDGEPTSQVRRANTTIQRLGHSVNFPLLETEHQIHFEERL